MTEHGGGGGSTGVTGCDITRLVTGILNHTQPHWDDELARRRQAARSA